MLIERSAHTLTMRDRRVRVEQMRIGMKLGLMFSWTNKSRCEVVLGKIPPLCLESDA